MKTDRLVAIIVMLLRRERVSAKELAEKFDVSVRTILRDVDAINLAGIPIVTYQGSGGGIGISPGYRIDKSVLNSDEMAAVLSALKGLEGTISGGSREVLMEKLKNTLNTAQLSSLDTKMRQFVIDLSPWHEDEAAKTKLALIREAIETSKTLTFTYTDSQGSKTARTAEPYSLMLKAQKWYLYAWCSLRQSFRYFKVARIKELALGGETFAPREVPVEQAAQQAQWQHDSGMVSLKLLFTKQMEDIIAEWWDLEEAEDGRLMAQATMPDNYQTVGFLLSFGNQVEVVSPPRIRDLLKDIALEIYKKYSSEHDI